MGVDVTIAIEGASAWNEDHRLAKEVTEWLGMYRETKPGESFESASGEWSVTHHQDLDLLELNCMTRYYGPGYERGPWEQIYAAIRALAAMYPGQKVYYGGDSDDVDQLPEATPERLEEIWLHYIGPHGDDYRARWR